jgi:hypothetical protein
MPPYCKVNDNTKGMYHEQLKECRCFHSLNSTVQNTTDIKTLWFLDPYSNMKQSGQLSMLWVAWSFIPLQYHFSTQSLTTFIHWTNLVMWLKIQLQSKFLHLQALMVISTSFLLWNHHLLNSCFSGPQKADNPEFPVKTLQNVLSVNCVV